MRYLLAIIFLGCAARVDARLGETSPQCIERYGEPVTVDKEKMQLGFHKSGMIILAYFREGKCIRIHFAKAPKGDLELSESLSDVEIQAIMEANGGGKKWEKLTMISADQFWQTEDEQLIANYKTFDSQLTLMTRTEVNRIAQEKAASEKKKLEGF